MSGSRTDKKRSDRGVRVRREVLGDAHVDRAVAATTAFTAPFQEYITRAVWGDIWTRPGLDRRTRSCITLAILTALGRDGELALHVRAALRNGLDPLAISEVLLHTAAYAGVPAANHAFSIAERVIQEANGTAQPRSTRGAKGPKRALAATSPAKVTKARAQERAAAHRKPVVLAPRSGERKKVRGPAFD